MTSQHHRRQMWQSPWGFAEGFVIAFGISLIGIPMQFLLGNILPSLY